MEATTLAPSSSSSGSAGMLLDGEDLLMLEESFRIGEDDDDLDEEGSMDFELEPLPLDDDDINSHVRRASSMWHHSAPCDLVGSSSSPAPETTTSSPTTEDLLALAAQRQWAPREGAAVGPGRQRQQQRQSQLRHKLTKKSKSFCIPPVAASVATQQPLDHPGRSLSFVAPIHARAAAAPAPGNANTTQPQQYCPPTEEEMIRRLAASMRRSGETRSRLFAGAAGSGNNKRHRTSAPPALLGCQIKAFQEEEMQQQQRHDQKAHEAAQAQLPRQQAQSVQHQPQPQGPPNPSAAPPAPAPPPVAPTQSILRLSGFLSGDLKTLTSGLERSRDMVRRHGSLIRMSGHDSWS